MFEDENERKVNDPEGYTPENTAADIQPDTQPIPTEYSAPEAPSEQTVSETPDYQNYTAFTPAEPAAPEAPAEPEADVSSEQSYIDMTSDFGTADNNTYQAPAQETPSYENQNNNVYSQQQPQAPAYQNNNGYTENPYSPYSDRQYANGNVNNNNPYYRPQAPAFNPQMPPMMPPQAGKPKKKAGKIILAVLAVILVFAIGFGSAAAILSKSKKSGSSSSGTGSSSSSDSTGKGTGDDTELEIESSPNSSKTSSTAEIAEKARKSNVGILIYTNTSSTSASGEGSGVVMSLDSTGEYTYIITCAHVIDTSGATVKVETEDGTTYDAEIVGYDTRTDLGVVRVHSTDFTCAEFGDSSELSVGDPVYAIGNPGGVEFFGTFTAGYVSAINRPISSEIGYTMKCIQHDAAINPGNSGGMLVNQYGQVIGINSQKIASTSYEGMGFAIPITDAKPIIEDLITYGYVPDRAQLGITYAATSSVTQYAIIAQANNLPAGTLVISSINSDSALSGTDVRKGDMIIAVNGDKLDTADVLLEAVDNGKVGDKMTLTIARVDSSYKVSTFDVTVNLVEDKGTTVEEESTEQSYNPYSYFGY